MIRTISRRTETPARSRPQLRVGALLTLLRVVAGALLVGFLFSAPVNAQSSDLTFTVDSTADDADAVGDGVCATAAGACTLRAAIREANRHPGPDTIAFRIPGDGVQTIQLTSALPVLQNASGPTTIDGYTQPDSSPNTDSLASNADIKVEIKGNGHDPDTGGFSGLTIKSPGNTVRGLAFYNLSQPIQLDGSDARDNHVAGNFIGTDAAGTYFASYVRYSSGIHVAAGAASNTIGGASAAERNVISGNAFHGVALYDSGTDSNVIAGNLIGLDPSGSVRLSNQTIGVDINTGASYNVVGGVSSGERNVISGNEGAGIEVSHLGLVDPANPVYPTGNQVIGNFVGTDVTGELAPEYSYNDGHGVRLEDHAKSTMIRENVIGNNGSHGILITHRETTDNQVYENLIGASRGGAAIPNGLSDDSWAGIAISGAKGSRVGPHNVIANNPNGVRISHAESHSNTVTHNSIYDNHGLGIDLDPLGTVNENDPGDADTGVNELQNSPEITSARVATRTIKRKKRQRTIIVGTNVAGTLNSAPNQTFTVELFSSPANDTNEGKTLLTQTSVSTDASGNGSFGLRTRRVAVGQNVTATATDLEGNTSEFSLNRPVSR